MASISVYFTHYLISLQHVKTETFLNLRFGECQDVDSLRPLQIVQTQTSQDLAQVLDKFDSYDQIET